MTEAKPGDRVQVHFTAKTDGEVFDSSHGRQAIEFKIGSGKMIPGFERAVTGMCPGDTKTVRIPPDLAFGPRRRDLVMSVRREYFPSDLNLSSGQRIQLTLRNQKKIAVTLCHVTDHFVEVDANHPLAGKDLELTIHLERFS